MFKALSENEMLPYELPQIVRTAQFGAVQFYQGVFFDYFLEIENIALKDLIGTVVVCVGM